MKTPAKILLLTLLLCLFTGYRPAQAQDPVTEVIRAGIKKAIVAMDLRIQRLQNKTIWLQNAQKVLENKLSELRLTEIADWSERQRKLYADYYEELWKVKAAIAYYERVQEIILRQRALVQEYQRAYRLFSRDGNFTPGELAYMQEVYSGILEESIRNLDQVLLVLSSFSLQMSDAGRLEIIHRAAEAIEENYRDLRRFNEHAMRLSLQRARERRSLEDVRRLYGLP